MYNLQINYNTKAQAYALKHKLHAVKEENNLVVTKLIQLIIL
jgi:hypothetical protein